MTTAIALKMGRVRLEERVVDMATTGWGKGLSRRALLSDERTFCTNGFDEVTETRSSLSTILCEDPIRLEIVDR